VLYYNIIKYNNLLTKGTATMANNTITLRLATETFEVKSVSAAWNKVRELRDSRGTALEGQILEVILPETIITDRIPANILFKANKNGKLEFKDLAKVKASEEKKAAKAASKKAIKAIEKAAIQTVNEVLIDEAEEDEDYPDQGEEFVTRDLAWSML
jgi:hypothetical protein